MKKEYLLLAGAAALLFFFKNKKKSEDNIEAKTEEQQEDKDARTATTEEVNTATDQPTDTETQILLGDKSGEMEIPSQAVAIPVNNARTLINTQQYYDGFDTQNINTRLIIADSGATFVNRN